MKKSIQISFLFIISLSFSQPKEVTTWYFGQNAGLFFSSPEVVFPIDSNAMNTPEGCSTISDSNGNLQFYTNGVSVWDRTHQIMPNGVGLLGGTSMTQSALIVPKPGDPNIYYIFTVVGNPLNPDGPGLNYSVVNMAANGGLGDVINKNVSLRRGSSEKIAAVYKDCGDDSLWVLTSARQPNVLPPMISFLNTFFAFEVTAAGINPTPVVSIMPNSTLDMEGQLKFSPNGSKIASANFTGGLFLYDFNTLTGIVSNQLNLTIDQPNGIPYGVEFSPNSEMLYVHSSNNFTPYDGDHTLPSNHRSKLTQFNLSAPDIQASQFLLDERQLFRGALQLAADGKIYRALTETAAIGTDYLGVINKPNEVGNACLYEHDAVFLNPNSSLQGLPSSIASYYKEDIDIIPGNDESNNIIVCEGSNFNLIGPIIAGATYTWSLNDTILPESDFDLEVTASGHYELSVEFTNQYGCKTLYGQAFISIRPLPVANPSSLFQCQNSNSNGNSLFNLYETYDDVTGGEPNNYLKFYTSLADAQNDQNEIANADEFEYSVAGIQTLYVRVTNNRTGCFSLTTVTLEVSTTSANNASLATCDNDGVRDGLTSFNLSDADATILAGLPPNLNVVYYATYNDAILEVNPLPNDYTNTNPNSQLIFARVENANACFGISEVQLNVWSVPDVDSEFETVYCSNFYPEPITLTGGANNSNNNYTYLWSTGETSPEITVNEIGTYSVRVTGSNGCFVDRTITVSTSNIATVTNIEVVEFSNNNSIAVFVSGDGDYEYALGNINGSYQESHVFENLAPGLYTVYIRDKNGCGIAEEIASILGFPKYFTPNDDGYNDYWQVYGISESFQPNTKIFIFDRKGKLLKQLDPLSRGWDGTFNGYKLPSTDYWFEVTLEDGRIFKNHFALKR